MDIYWGCAQIFEYPVKHLKQKYWNAEIGIQVFAMLYLHINSEQTIWKRKANCEQLWAGAGSQVSSLEDKRDIIH